jgi:hypothetical protein
MSTRRQGTTLFAAILVLVASTVVVQLWLLTVAMEALLSGNRHSLVPSAIGSTVAAGQRWTSSLRVSLRSGDRGQPAIAACDTTHSVVRHSHPFPANQALA